ncbi:uncharacterized protein LTR77_011221 [Saxophila tyrrhenica]|uniref:Uncharacterized protein n=1 Tax=Saxophila tyrrhenica TaxID=1690608 RepID=A0AAV9NX21_9PEZI|nr:hypothetical protein LTR77_011221 [Saxophila tyrrhenica]
MQRSIFNPRLFRASPTSSTLLHRQPLSTSTARHGVFTKERDDTLDPSKEGTDVTEKQAKNPKGANPAEQQAKIVKQQGPGQTQQEGRTQQKAGGAMGDGNTQQAGLGKKSDPSQKSGEEAVNPAVKS